MNPEQPASSPADSLHAEAREVLRRLTGVADAEFHDGQYEAIRALVADRARTLVVQRTGWGKSAVYVHFFPAVACPRYGPGSYCLPVAFPHA